MTTLDPTQSAAEISESTLGMLRKLYERSKRSDSHLDTEGARESAEREAAQAAEMLGRLLDQYGLALADVDRSGTSHQIGTSHVGESKLDFGKSQFTWKVELARAVAKHNMVTILSEKVVRGKVTEIVFVGLALHVEATMMMLEWLYGQIRSIASADYKAHKAAKPWDHIDPLRWHTSFGKGAGERLGDRLQLIRAQQQQAERQAAQGGQAGPTTSLAINIDTAVRDYMEQKEPWRKEVRERDEAYQARWQMERVLEPIQKRAYQVWFDWQTPWLQVVYAKNMLDWSQGIQKRNEEWTAEREKARQKRRRYEDRFYDRHGYYPGEGRYRAEKVDNTNYTAYDRGRERADNINLQPHLEDGNGQGSSGKLPG